MKTIQDKQKNIHRCRLKPISQPHLVFLTHRDTEFTEKHGDYSRKTRWRGVSLIYFWILKIDRIKQLQINSKT